VDWAKIAEMAFTFIASIGGIGVIVTGVVKYLSDYIAEKLSKKYQLQLNKELEKYKTTLSKKEYVSKTRFDAEFRMYQELSEKNITMVYNAGQSVLIARGASFTDAEIDQIIENICNSINDAEMTNKRYAPFISQEIYNQYLILEKTSSEILSLLKVWKMYNRGDVFNFRTHGNTYHNQQEVNRAIEIKQKYLSDRSNDLLDILREYLRKLDVMEETDSE